MNIQDCARHLDLHIENHPNLAQKVACITAIEGVGTLTAAVIISELNDFQLIESQRQLVSYCGYDVVENQSGNRNGKKRISKKGNAHVRRILHMPAFNVVRLGVKPFVDLFHRVFNETKIKMKAYVAVQKKLLTIIYTIYKKGEKFDPQFLEKSLKTNAPILT